MFINSTIQDNISRNNISCYVKNYVSSTNDYLNYGYIRDQSPIIILANNQRSPRGRRGKKWINFQGMSLGFSLCLKFNTSPKKFCVLSHLVGLSIIESCRILGNKSLKIKWPNDIMQGEKKVCGTLIENLIVSENAFYSIIGFGFNISIPDDLIDFIDGSPGNLNIIKKNIDLIPSTTASILIKNISFFEKNGFTNYKDKWNENMYGKSKKISLISNGQKYVGKLLGINKTGELEIETDDEIVNVSDINYSMRIL